jgi:hypothetical protein
VIKQCKPVAGVSALARAVDVAAAGQQRCQPVSGARVA